MLKSKYNSNHCQEGIGAQLEKIHEMKVADQTIEDFRQCPKQLAKRFDCFRGFKFRYFYDLIDGNISNKEVFFQRDDRPAADEEIQVSDLKKSTSNTNLEKSKVSSSNILIRNQSGKLVAKRKLNLQDSSKNLTGLLKENYSEISVQRPLTALGKTESSKDKQKSQPRLQSSGVRLVSSSKGINSRPSTAVTYKGVRFVDSARSKDQPSVFRPESAYTEHLERMVVDQLFKWESEA